MKYITLNFVLLLLFFISFSLGDELGFPESIGNAEGSKKRSLDIRTGGNTIGVLNAANMPVMPVQNFQQTRPQQSIYPSYRTQMVQVARMPQPQGPNKRQLMMTEASSLPLGVPPFKSIPKNTLLQVQRVSPSRPQVFDNRQATGADRYLKTMKNSNMQVSGERISPFYAEPVPDFQALPSSIITATLAQPTKVEYFPKDDLPEIDLKGHTIEELALAANVSVDVIKAAIKLRQNQMMIEKRNAEKFSKQKPVKSTTVVTTPSTTSVEQTEKVTTQSTTKTTTKLPSTTPYVPKKKVTKKPLKNGYKVMNAPNEYYPVGYEKNFDDGFKSRIDLPATSFHCGDQKHFPGLYADQDLGCMVFHVCALTDDGLIMKSFLCPESTLFDQTILKCNWWFYTDCKSSKSLYDSNLPVSKSYQLMKSLAYFNKHYQKAGNSTAEISSTKSENAIQPVSIVTAKDQQ